MGCAHGGCGTRELNIEPERYVGLAPNVQTALSKTMRVLPDAQMQPKEGGCARWLADFP